MRAGGGSSVSKHAGHTNSMAWVQFLGPFMKGETHSGNCPVTFRMRAGADASIPYVYHIHTYTYRESNSKQNNLKGITTHLFLWVLGVKPRASGMPGKCFVAEVHLPSSPEIAGEDKEQ